MKLEKRIFAGLAAVLLGLSGAVADAVPARAAVTETQAATEEAQVATAEAQMAASETAVTETQSVGEARTGMGIQDIYTDKSMYTPGDPVQVTVELKSGAVKAGMTLDVKVKHLGTVVQEQERALAAGSAQDTFTLTMPAEDFQGYALEVYLKEQDRVVDYEMTAVDVSSDWSRFPRYGYLSKMDHRTDQEIQDTLERLKRHHINGLFYYDVFDTQDKPLAGTVAQPAAEWKSLATQTVDAASLKKTIAAGHSLNMRSFFYNLIFGAYDGYEERGISPEWGLYTDQRHEHQDSHDLGDSGWETSRLWMFNPANVDWQNHFLEVHRDLLQVYDFDGLQMDSLGSRGSGRYDYWGNPLELDQTYTPFLRRLTELGTRVIFNPVGSYGLQQVLNSGVYDVIYVEVWPSDNKDYQSLKGTLDRIYAVTKGEKGSILGAYMDYDVMKGEPFNLPGILYTNAMMSAAGGSHLELGDTGMLSSEYYPGNSLRITKELEKRLRNYYSFMVAYENLLRGTGLTEDKSARTFLNGTQTSPSAVPGTVYSFAKKKENKLILQLLNYDGASIDAWVDSRGGQTAPTVKRNVTVTQNVDHAPEHVWVASPDYQEGIMQEVAFTYENGAVTFTLPYLEYWTMAVME